MWMAPHVEDDYCDHRPHADLEYEDIPPPRIDDNAFMADYTEHDKQLAAEFDEREVEEEEYHTHVRMGLAPTDEDIRAAGGDDAQVKANELARIARRAEYLHSTQSRDHADQTGLQASHPISINSIPPKPNSFAAAAATAPKPGSVWTVVGKKSNPRPRQPAQPTTNNNTPKPYTIEKLSARRTTKTDIINHTHSTFGIQLSDKMQKPQLIVAYQQLAANPKLTGSQTPTPQLIQTPTCPQQRPAAQTFTSEWTIRRCPGMEAIDFQRPFNGDPLALVRHIQTSLRQHSAEPEPPLTVVAG
jgi:hypothetical protein